MLNRLMSRNFMAWACAGVAVILAIPILWASLSAQDSGGLAVSMLALLLAAVWFAGGVGVLRLGPRASRGLVVQTSPRRTTAVALTVGGALAAASLLGGLVLASWPATAPLVAAPLAAADSQQPLVLLSVALVAGAAEEVFFRLALPSLLTGWGRWVVPTALYTAATLVTGSLGLALMAAILGLTAMWVLETTGRWFAPIMVHAIWTVTMIGLFPRLVDA